MLDPTLFTTGNLFTTDYLVEGVRQTAEYLAVDTAALRATLLGIVEPFRKSASPNEAQTKNDLIWPVLGALRYLPFRPKSGHSTLLARSLNPAIRSFHRGRRYKLAVRGRNAQ